MKKLLFTISAFCKINREMTHRLPLLARLLRLELPRDVPYMVWEQTQHNINIDPCYFPGLCILNQ